MLPSLKRSLKKLRRTNDRVLRCVAGWTPAQLHTSPGPGEWSAAQVIDHIARVETSFLQAVQANLSQPRRLTANDRVGMLIVRAVMRSRMRVKTPKEAVDILPAGDATLASAMGNWQRSQQAWVDFLEHVTPSQLKGGVFFHARGGWMNLRSALKLLRLHHNHHRVQFSRISAALGKR